MLWAAAALALTSAAAANAADGELVKVGSPRFPERAFVLTLPEKTQLDASMVRVLENGKAVTSLTVVPASAAGSDEFGVVLVIDASNSMTGDAIEGAMEAARIFAAQRNSQQQLAVVTFNRHTAVLLPFTADESAIQRALQEPPSLGRGTRLYEGVAKAAELVQAAEMTAASIVVLTDGGDTGSAITLEEAASAAQDAHARVFTVGLRSPDFSASTLKAMAGQGGGVYAEARSADDLVNVYNRLGAQLANEHLIRYRSLAGPAETIQVEVIVDGVEGSATASYTTPSLRRYCSSARCSRFSTPARRRCASEWGGSSPCLPAQNRARGGLSSPRSSWGAPRGRSSVRGGGAGSRRSSKSLRSASRPFRSSS
jgi:Mg-chelatase subunit ChlD